MLQQFQSALMLIQQQAMIDPAFAQMAMQAGVIAPEQMAEYAANAGAAVPAGNGMQGTAEERAAKTAVGASDNSQATKARVRAANAAAPR